MLSFSTVTSGDQVADALLDDEEEFVRCLISLSERIKTGGTNAKELDEALQEHCDYQELENIQKFAYLIAKSCEEIMSYLQERDAERRAEMRNG